MIKPASYWALHKVADPATLGRVGVSLAGREAELEPPLSAAEAALVAVVKQDSEWHDERIEAMRRKEAERKAAYRKRKGEDEGQDGTTRDNAGQRGTDGASVKSHEVTPSPAPYSPSIHNNIINTPPSNSNTSVMKGGCGGDGDPPASARTRARASKPPSLDEVLKWAADGLHHPDGRPIPEEFAREWHALMEMADPPWTNTRGRSVAGGWRREIIWAWRREQKYSGEKGGGGRRAGTNQPEGVIHREDGYENPL